MFKQDLFVGTELFSADTPITIGRHPHAGIRLDADTVSRQHSRITFDAGQLRLEDLDSGNGTFINDRRVETQCDLHFRDTIRIGPYTIKVRLLENSGPVPFDPMLSLATTRVDAPTALVPEAPDAEIVDETIRDCVQSDTQTEEPVLTDAHVGVVPYQDMDPSAESTIRALPRFDSSPANDDPGTERILRSRVLGRRPRSDVHESGRQDDAPLPHLAAMPRFHGIEVAARAGGRLNLLTVLRASSEEYILGYPTPDGTMAPVAGHHRGLRLVKVNEDRTVDLVFPHNVGGYLIRGPHTVALRSLCEGRKYSCLRLLPHDVAAIHLGRGHDAVSYHLRFLRRPASTLRDLQRTARP